MATLVTAQWTKVNNSSTGSECRICCRHPSWASLRGHHDQNQSQQTFWSSSHRRNKVATQEHSPRLLSIQNFPREQSENFCMFFNSIEKVPTNRMKKVLTSSNVKFELKLRQMFNCLFQSTMHTPVQQDVFRWCFFQSMSEGYLSGSETTDGDIIGLSWQSLEVIVSLHDSTVTTSNNNHWAVTGSRLRSFARTAMLLSVCLVFSSSSWGFLGLLLSLFTCYFVKGGECPSQTTPSMAASSVIVKLSLIKLLRKKNPQRSSSCSALKCRQSGLGSRQIQHCCCQSRQTKQKTEPGPSGCKCVDNIMWVETVTTTKEILYHWIVNTKIHDHVQYLLSPWKRTQPKCFPCKPAHS